MAAYDLNQDKIYGHVKVKKDRTTFLEFCRYLRTLYPPNVRIAIVMDNFSPHLSTKVDSRVGDWAEANNVELAYVPTNASWMNRIEAQFQALRYFTLDGTDHRSHEEQNSMIRRYIIWRNRNAHDKTFVSWSSAQTLPDAALASSPVGLRIRHKERNHRSRESRWLTVGCRCCAKKTAGPSLCCLTVASQHLAVHDRCRETRCSLLDPHGSCGEIVGDFRHQRRYGVWIKDCDIGRLAWRKAAPILEPPYVGRTRRDHLDRLLHRKSLALPHPVGQQMRVDRRVEHLAHVGSGVREAHRGARMLHQRDEEVVLLRRKHLEEEHLEIVLEGKVDHQLHRINTEPVRLPPRPVGFRR